MFHSLIGVALILVAVLVLVGAALQGVDWNTGLRRRPMARSAFIAAGLLVLLGGIAIWWP